MQLVIAHLSAPASVPLVCFIEWHELKVQAREFLSIFVFRFLIIR